MIVAVWLSLRSAVALNSGLLWENEVNQPQNPIHGVKMPQFDEFEIKILERLQSDGRMPVSELAQEIGLSTTPCARRFDALRETGVIKGFQAVISRRAVGLTVEVFVQVRLISHSDESPERFIAAVERLDEVSACWTMTGEYDFLLHVMVPSVDDLNEFVMHRLMRLQGVRDVHTQLVLSNIKGPGHVPLKHLKSVPARPDRTLD